MYFVSHWQCNVAWFLKSYLSFAVSFQRYWYPLFMLRSKRGLQVKPTNPFLGKKLHVPLKAFRDIKEKGSILVKTQLNSGQSIFYLSKSVLALLHGMIDQKKTYLPALLIRCMKKKNNCKQKNTVGDISWLTIKYFQNIGAFDYLFCDFFAKNTLLLRY